MKSIFVAAGFAAMLGFSGAAFADDAMSNPMEGDAMASDAMAGDAMGGDAMATHMTPQEVLDACLAKAMEVTDTMKKDEADKLCHDVYDTAMAGDAMGGDAMAGDAMAGDAMAPAK